ncbi:MAG TPA: hypothetical protein VGE11_08350 [Pseudonocardia sp.]
MPTSHARLRKPSRARTAVAAAVLFTGLLCGGGAALANPVAQGHQQADKAGTSHDDQADVPNPNCTLIVPPAPLTAAGLGTPYRLKATDRDGGRCHEANPVQSAFVEATILDPATGKLATYRPLVIDDGTSPAAPVVIPTLPARAVVGVWFGFQGDVLTLRTQSGDGCVNGLHGSPFGQFGYCGAPAFFEAARAAIAAKKLTVPPLGTANDGKPCPSTRDFAVVDQDQSDNLTTSYLALRDGRTAQDTQANAALPHTKRLTNASDNGLLVKSIDPALGCKPFTAPDLTAGGTPSTSLALNELQAAAHQTDPIALVPPNDPMALDDDHTSNEKMNLYRVGVDMPPLSRSADTDSAKAYCTNLATVAPKRLDLDRKAFKAAPSPDPKNGRNLDDFLIQRLKTSLKELNCRDATDGDGH